MAKSVRRDMRRAMGEGALGTIKEQDTAIGMIANGLANVQREIATLAISHASERKRTDHISTKLTAFNNQGVLGRLRWLFTGK